MVKTIATYDSNAKTDMQELDEWDLLSMAMLEKEELAGKIYQNVFESMARMSENVLSGEANNVFSPVALYMALSVLSEMTNGNSRQQILDTLELEEDKVQETFRALAKISYMEHEMATSKISSSIWMNENMEYRSDKLMELCDTYQTSSYAGKMGSEELNSAIAEWLKAATGNRLRDKLKVETMPEMLLEMFTTIYFCSKWKTEFDPADTTLGEFTVSEEKKVRCEYMHQETRDIFHKGEAFTAMTKELTAGYDAVFVLPKEGVSVDDLFSNNQFKELFVTGGINDSEEYLIKLAMPKIDISSKVDLLDVLKALGVEDVLKPETADFTPISSESQLCLSKAEQTSRFTVREDGIEAAFCVEMGISFLGLPPEVDEVEFTLDRPFLFMVVAEGNVPVFFGKVMDPTQYE